jgi:hypothetical protein
MEEILKRLREKNCIHEMATVGRFTVKKGNNPKSNKYTVFTTSDSNMPQVHVHIKNTEENIYVCLKLDKPEYFSHGNYRDKLDSNQIASLIDFFNSKSSQRIYSIDNVEYKLRTQWEYTIALWNVENPNQQIKISKDESGYIVVPPMPNYNKLRFCK